MDNKDKVINELLGRIANLEREVERLNNIINATIEYINNSSCFDGSYMNKHDLLMLLSGIIVRSDKE